MALMNGMARNTVVTRWAECLQRQKGRRQLLIKLLLILSACIGFLTQVTHVSSEYFAYHTSNKIKTVQPQKIIVPRISLCIRYNDIFDADRFLNDTGIRVKRVYNLETVIAEASKVTLAQVFEYTPDADQVMDSCYYRLTEFDYIQANKSTCNQRIKVSKFYMQEYICYQFEETVRLVRAVSITHSLFYSYKIFEVGLSAVFKRAVVVAAMAHYHTYPHIARDYTSYKALYPDARHLVNRSCNFLLVSGKWTAVELLESPYDTRCVPRDLSLYYDCFARCLIHRMSPIDRVPYSEILIHPFDKKHLNLNDLADPGTYDKVKRWNSECNKQCYFRPCIQHLSVTTTHEDMLANISMGFAALSPPAPGTQTTAVPTMTPIEYFSFVCSCFGTWFGLSFLSLVQLKKGRKHSSVTTDARAAMPRPSVQTFRGKNWHLRNY